MVAAGNGHGLRIRVFGEKASLHWDQDSPDELFLRADGAPYRTLRRGEAYLCADARHASRTKAGNPEGYFGAFANLYADAAEVIEARRDRPTGRSVRDDIRDGARRRPRDGVHRGRGRFASQRRRMDPMRAGRGAVVRRRRRAIAIIRKCNGRY